MIRFLSFALLIAELVLLTLLALRQANGETRPINDVVCDRVDVLEAHHFYDEYGRLVFDQLVGWDFYSDGEHVVFWRLIKSDSLIPRRDWQRGGYCVYFLDGERTWRYVSAPMQRERWTQWDVELIDRDSWPKEKRRELRAVK